VLHEGHASPLKRDVVNKLLQLDSELLFRPRYLEQLLPQRLLYLSHYVLRHLAEAAEVDQLTVQVEDLLVLRPAHVA
jgi:hypothetical protein